MRAIGFGVDDGRSPRGLWAALTPGVALLVAPRPWFAVGLGLDGKLARPGFTIGNGGGEVWRPGRVGLRAWLGVGGVRCWGYNSEGELGLATIDAVGDDELPSSVPPVAVVH